MKPSTSTSNLPYPAPTRRSLSLALLLLPAFSLSACGGSTHDGSLSSVDGIRVKTTINRPGLYDLEINGIDCEVSIAAGNTIRRLLITGANNTIRVPSGVTIERIDFTGSDNSVHVPKGFQALVTGVGSGNRVRET